MKPIAWLTIFVWLFSANAAARDINDIEAHQRETRIVADVMRSALRQELRQDVRVTNVSAEYLPKQGVLLSVTLNTPWLKIDERGEPHFEFHGNISLPEIPAMVNNILQDLQINVAPYEPEALEELRDLREEQRELRSEARDTRAELRSERRDLIRSEGDHERGQIESEIARLEEQLSRIDAHYDQLTAEIETQYQRMREVRDVVPTAPTPVTPQPPQPVDVEEVLTQAVCDYGSTLKSLNSQEFLTLAVRKGKSTSYYAFRMEHVDACNKGNLKVPRLLELAYQYEG